MNYLICAKPDVKTVHLFKAASNGYIPKNGYHITLSFFDAPEIALQGLKLEHKHSYISPINPKIIGIEDFDHGKQVLRVSSTQRLQSLHENMVNSARRYADPLFEETVEKYYLDKYDPHISVEKTDSLVMESPELIDLKVILDRFAIAKKD